MLQQRYIHLTLALMVALGLFALACTRAEPTSMPTLTPTATTTQAPAATPTATATQAPAATPTATTTQAPAATPTRVGPEPQRGGTLVLAARDAAPSYDVHQEFSTTLAARGPGLVYSRLLRLKSGPGVELPSLQVECELCQSWEVKDDGKTYLFHLRSDVSWQNAAPVNGRLVTAQDIVASYQRQATEGWPNAGLLRSIESIEADDDTTLRVTLVVPDADFLLALADGHSKVVAPEVVALSGTLTGGPNIGSGPWLWSGESGGAYTLLRNPDYFEQGLPYLDELRIHVIPDDDTRITAYLTGLLDVIDITPEAWASLSAANSGIPSLSYPAAGTGMELALNTRRAPFNRLEIRQAFFAALDPWADIEEVWAGDAFVALGMPVAQADWLLSRQELEPYFNDPARAVSALEANTGVSNAFTLRVGEFGEQYIQHAQRIKQALEAVGFQPTIERVNLKTFAEDVWFGGNYTAFLGAIPPTNTPNGYFRPIFHSLGEWNTHGFQDEELDGLIDSQEFELDPVLRATQVRQIQELVFDQAFRFMPSTQVQRWTWTPRLQDFFPNFAVLEYSFWSRVWLAQ